jgi:Family of unknown function (DUF6510)
MFESWKEGARGGTMASLTPINREVNVEELDGNGAAGKLREVFALEVTTARGQCNGCGNVAALGEARVFMDAPGLVVRCRNCESVLLVLVSGEGRYWLGSQGLAWLELGAG